MNKSLSYQNNNHWCACGCMHMKLDSSKTLRSQKGQYCQQAYQEFAWKKYFCYSKLESISTLYSAVIQSSLILKVFPWNWQIQLRKNNSIPTFLQFITDNLALNSKQRSLGINHYMEKNNQREKCSNDRVQSVKQTSNFDTEGHWRALLVNASIYRSAYSPPIWFYYYSCQTSQQWHSF